jgi:tRNA threonylcarbamoyladenosine biosynthesis protein TsaB
MTAGGPLLAVDTATTHAVVALGSPDGVLIESLSWVAGYRHGEELLARIESLLADRGLGPADLGGLVTGTGPGAFTGLRVGLATIKGLAHALGLPVAGVPTALALARAAAIATGIPVESIVLVQPAGPNDRVVSRAGSPSTILPGGTEPDLGPSDVLVAVDLDGRAPGPAVTRGAMALAGFPATLLAAGAARLETGDTDDLALLVPEYVTLPRGVRALPADGGVEVSGGSRS